MSEKTLGVIPARAGSKRVPDKNIREMDGKPLIAHAIEQANNSQVLDEVIISTDNKKIQKVAEEYGGNVPFQRPAKLATDEATNDKVIQHALDWFESKNELFKYVCLVSVTTPFRSVNDIDKSLSKLYKSSSDSIVSVTTYDIPPFWAIEFNGEELDPYFDENPWKKTRTQEFPKLYHPNGAIFAARVSAFEKVEGFYTDHTIGYKMPPKRSLDIDEPFDLELARALVSKRQQ